MSEYQSPEATDIELHYECVQFYNEEAQRLDAKALEAWLELLTEDVTYDMPIRVTREKGAERSEFSGDAFNYREDRSTLEARVERFQSEFAWSEDPPSRTRHHVSNIRVVDVDGDEITTKNNLLLFRGQGDDTEGVLLSGERHDILRRVDGTLKLADRSIKLDHTIIPMKNISVFF